MMVSTRLPGPDEAVGQVGHCGYPKGAIATDECFT